MDVANTLYLHLLLYLVVVVDLGGLLLVLLPMVSLLGLSLLLLITSVAVFPSLNHFD